MAFTTFTSLRLIKSEDINHHGTLFAGRCAEWFVESGFIAGAAILPPHNIVCLKIHGMEFLHPVHLGDTLCFKSSVVSTGRSTFTVFVQVVGAYQQTMLYSSGFMTFCHVDKNTRPCPHGIVVVADTEQEKQWQAQALALKSK